MWFFLVLQTQSTKNNFISIVDLLNAAEKIVLLLFFELHGFKLCESTHTQIFFNKHYILITRFCIHGYNNCESTIVFRSILGNLHIQKVKLVGCRCLVSLIPTRVKSQLNIYVISSTAHKEWVFLLPVENWVQCTYIVIVENSISHKYLTILYAKIFLYVCHF